MYPTLDRTGPTPIYLQIKEWMRQQITSGAWPRSFKLRPEVDLADEMEVSRGTMRKAIEELTEEGLLTRTHGRGTFVASEVLEQALADRMITFSEDLISRGIPFTTHVFAATLTQATPRLAAKLGLEAGQEIFLLKRMRMVEGEALVASHSYVVHQHCPGIAAVDFERSRLFEVLEDQFGLRVARGRRTFQALEADADTAARLGIVAGAPVMYIEQFSYLETGALVEFSEVWLRGDRFKLITDARRNGLSALSMAPAHGDADNHTDIILTPPLQETHP
ncbi:MAG: GntR family transcriptional regulator [Caldilineales bacterium]|nr:GntR family transcriptional regulator [Caldilineales bacterium]MCW5857206.1 GntR family transcriptional regulator [Caldilineales bacterium]